MTGQSKLRPMFKKFVSIPAVTLALAFLSGCIGLGIERTRPDITPACSFLRVPPLTGDETEPRDPPPTTSRLVVAEESVEGWLSPEENVLRFPVDLRPNAHISLRIGAVAEVPVTEGDLVLRTEFAPGDDGRREAVTIFEASPKGANWTKDWLTYNAPIENVPPGKGELRFIVEGPLAGDPGIEILWGQPTIYYPEQRRHKNVLLIGIDTLRADGIEPYEGRDGVSPGLVAFAERATLFRQAWSQASWTLPSFASMLTGLYPSQIAPTATSCRIPPHATTISEMLLKLGYATGTVCGNPHLKESSSGIYQGMESFWYRLDASPHDSLMEARRFIQRAANRDWFCFLHIMDPHTPYRPPEAYVERFCDPAYDGEIGEAFTIAEEWWQLESPPRDEDVTHARNLYDGEIANLDTELNAFFAYMDQIGAMENTLVILASDHGEEFFEHGRFEHGHAHYDELVHVPLLVHGPGFGAGMDIDAPVANTDIVPTILEFVGTAVPPDLPGIPLQHVVLGRENGDRIIFGEGTIVRGCGHEKFAVEWPYKCILDFFTGQARLYDLVNDPGETVDISQSSADIASRLSREMALSLPPIRTMFLVYFLGYADERDHVFEGTFTLPGGVKHAQAPFGATPSPEDSTELDGNTITFRITYLRNARYKFKGFMIIPEDGADRFEATLRLDGGPPGERFFPYGDATPCPDGAASASIYDFPWPARMSADASKSPVACYVIGIQGVDPEELREFVDTAQVDPETLEQLRALGYVN